MSRAVTQGVVFAEIIKVLLAASLAARWHQHRTL
jgi:hypothetical protein